VDPYVLDDAFGTMIGKRQMAIRLRVIGLERNVGVYPVHGKVRLTLILEGGARRELELPLPQLDQIAVSLLDVAERGRLAGAQQGYAHDLKPAEMTTGFPPSGGLGTCQRL
jgi:hypothetical protein